MPSPLEVAHAMRTTAAWVRTAPEDQRCSGALARDQHGDKTDHNSDHALRWCAIGMLARQLRHPLPYQLWEQWGSKYRLDNEWDEAMYARNGRIRDRHIRENTFEDVAQRLDHAAKRIEEAVLALETDENYAIQRHLVCS